MSVILYQNWLRGCEEVTEPRMVPGIEYSCTYQSSYSNCGDSYCKQNKQIFITRFWIIFLEFPDEVPMGKIFLQSFNLWELEKFGNDPASRLATCSQVIEIHKSCWIYNKNLSGLSMRKSKFIIIKGFYTNLSESNIENILIENFHRFVMDFQTNLRILITWLQDASLEAGSWPNFSNSHKLKLWRKC